MPLPAPVTAWGVREVLRLFLVACLLYNKHRDRCERFLTPELCGILSAVCGAAEQISVERAALPPVGTRGSGV